MADRTFSIPNVADVKLINLETGEEILFQSINVKQLEIQFTPLKETKE